MSLMGCNFYKQIFNCYQKLSSINNVVVKEKQNKLIDKVEIAIQKRDREYQEVYSVIHEIRLYDFLRRKSIGTRMNSDLDAGPDFESDFGYIECVSVTKGEGKNRDVFNETMSGRVNRYTAGEPRITSVIVDKKKKYDGYIVNNNIDKTKPRIIAVSTSILSNEVCCDLLAELMRKVLYGIDTPVIRVKKQGEKIIDTEEFFIYNNITTDKNKKFQSAYFENDDFKDISAVILNHNAFTEDINDKYFEIYLNPNANIPVDIQKVQGFKYFYLKSSREGEKIYAWGKNKLLNSH